jgi:hypothetical protein
LALEICLQKEFNAEISRSSPQMYDELRQANVARNRKMMQDLGLLLFEHVKRSSSTVQEEGIQAKGNVVSFVLQISYTLLLVSMEPFIYFAL